MSLRPRFSNSPGPHSSSTTTAAANQHNGATTAKDHHHHRRHRLLIFSESRHRLSILFLILLLLTTSSLYFFDDLFANLLDHHDDDDASRKITSSFVLQARFLRGLLGVGQVQQKGTIRIPPTRQEHPRMVTVDIPESNKNQQKAEAAVVVVTSALLESPPRRVDGGGGAAMVVLDQPMSTEQILQDSNTNERENKKDLGLADPLETKECKAQYQWQLDSKPTCNALHEMDMRHFVDKKDTHGDHSDENVLRERVRLIANGGWRDVWGLIDDYNDHHRSGDIGHSEDAIENDGDESKTNDRYVVLKTLLYPKEVVPRNVERHRRDAMAMERLTSSQNIVDIYAFCGNSGLFEFAKGGDLEAAVHALAKSFYTNGQLTREERLQRLQLGVQGAMGLADLHNFDQEGRPSVAHTDISLGQFVKIDGRFKLNDFNRARFLLEDRKTKEVCPYHVGGNPGRSRSPEEYKYTDQTEKVDVYSFGNILYTLLTLEKAFYDLSAEDAQELVIGGKRPEPTDKFGDDNPALQMWTSNDPIDLALRSAMELCLIYNVTERATARQVETFLKAQLERIDPGRLEAWGVK